MAWKATCLSNFAISLERFDRAALGEEGVSKSCNRRRDYGHDRRAARKMLEDSSTVEMLNQPATRQPKCSQQRLDTRYGSNYAVIIKIVESMLCRRIYGDAL
jgi:hypothetical protein